MTADTAAATTDTGFRRRPLASLGRAEYLQFVRNKTLVYMGIGFPIGLPLLTFLLQRRDTDQVDPVPTFEYFVLMALLFLMYYSVLSMVTTRRGEGVLKRLRTGEAADWQIQAAPAVPGVLITLAGLVVVPAVVYAAGSAGPVNPVLVVLAVLWGLALFALFALATSGLTKNAEAAQLTSLPVMALAIVGLGSLRGALPERFAAVVDWTPFAAISDLISLGAAGRLTTAAGSDPALDFAGTFGEVGRPVVTLVGWTLLALLLTRQYFRWDDRG